MVRTTRRKKRWTRWLARSVATKLSHCVNAIPRSEGLHRPLTSSRRHRRLVMSNTERRNGSSSSWLASALSEELLVCQGFETKQRWFDLGAAAFEQTFPGLIASQLGAEAGRAMYAPFVTALFPKPRSTQATSQRNTCRPTVWVGEQSCSRASSATIFLERTSTRTPKRRSISPRTIIELQITARRSGCAYMRRSAAQT